MESQADKTTSAAGLPTDVLHRTFEIAIAISPFPSGRRGTVAEFFTNTPPYNIMHVCRSWRDAVLSGPTLWSSFAFSFSAPSVRTLEALEWLIRLHVVQSQSTPLSFYVELLHAYDANVVGQIINLLVGQQGRWKRALLHVFPAPPLATHLNIEDLGLLEVLHLNLSTSFIPSTTTVVGSSQEPTLPSLKRLELGMPSNILDSQTFRWLQASPNVRYLNIFYTHNSSVTQCSSRFPTRDGPLGLPHLHFLQAGSTDAHSKRPLAASMLTYITCTALVELHLFLYNAGSEDALFDFFSRSAPPLRVLSLSIESGHVSWGEQRYTILLNALALVPTVNDFRVEWYKYLSVNILIQEMARKRDPGRSDSPFAILPMVERLEIIHNRDVRSESSPEYVELIRARWNSHPRTLKTVKIGGALVTDDVTESAEMKLYVLEGLQLET